MGSNTGDSLRPLVSSHDFLSLPEVPRSQAGTEVSRGQSCWAQGILQLTSPVTKTQFSCHCPRRSLLKQLYKVTGLLPRVNIRPWKVPEGTGVDPGPQESDPALYPETYSIPIPANNTYETRRMSAGVAAAPARPRRLPLRPEAAARVAAFLRRPTGHREASSSLLLLLLSASSV